MPKDEKILIFFLIKRKNSWYYEMKLIHAQESW